MLIQLAMNITGINVVALLNQVSVWWHIAIVGAVVVLVFLGRQARCVGADALRDPATGRRRAAGRTTRASSSSITDRRSYPIVLAFFFSLLPGELDLHGLRRLGPRRGGDGRRPRRQRMGHLPVGRCQRGRRLRLPVRAVDPSARSCRRSSRNPLPIPWPSSQYYFGDGAAVIDILVYNLGTTVGGLLQPGIAIAMAFCGLSAIASAGRMLFAFSRDDGVPGSGWLKKVSHRYRTPANSLDVDRRDRMAVHGRGVLRWQTGHGRHRHGDQHDLPVRRVRCRHLSRCHDPGLAERTRLESRPLVRSRSPGSPSPGSSS